MVVKFTGAVHKTLTPVERQRGLDEGIWPDLPILLWWRDWPAVDIVREGVVARVPQPQRHGRLKDRAIDKYHSAFRQKFREEAEAMKNMKGYRHMKQYHIAHSLAAKMFKKLPATEKENISILHGAA